MKKPIVRKHRRSGRAFFGSALFLGLSQATGIFAQDRPPTPPVTNFPAPPSTEISAVPDGNAPATIIDCQPTVACDPMAPTWCNPICRVPNFFGDFFGRGIQACRDTRSSRTFTTTRPLQFTGSGAEGGGFNNLVPPYVGPNGPGGPYTLTQPIPINQFDFQTGAFTLGPNGELTQQVTAKFPGATFVDGGGVFTGNQITDADFFYNYLFTNTQTINSGELICVNLPNPSGGGLIGRNKFFDNGSPVPHDRVYFDYQHVGNFNGLGTNFDVNRYQFGAEKTFFNGRCSFEVRAPFAGTVNSSQIAGSGLAVDHAELGNIGLAAKVALWRSATFLVTAGLGVSLPTADDSQLIINGQSDIEIRNHATILQPLFGVVWAPTDRFYTQMGLQFDFDPSGNPVLAADATNNLVRIGTLRDQTYAFLSGAMGYWIYQGDGAIRGVALQSELHYNSAWGSSDGVQSGNVAVTYLNNQFNVVNADTGVIVNVGDRTSLSLAVSAPISGGNLYDWSALAQVNFRFGAH